MKKINPFHVKARYERRFYILFDSVREERANNTRTHKHRVTTRHARTPKENKKKKQQAH